MPVASATSATQQSPAALHELAQQLRADAIRCTTAAGSGHPTSAMSAAELMAVLLANHLSYDFGSPHRPDNDRLILSKGHAAPLLYAALRAVGAISDEELMTLRRFGSPLEGHPTPRIPFVDAATGSLGQGLALGVGAALAGKRVDRRPFTVWVLLGDSELAEGSNYEAMEAADYYRLDNLVAILDVNRLGQRGETALGWNLDRYRQRFEGFGWTTVVVDGHDPAAIDAAYAAARSAPGPACVIARTVKGQGVSFTANAEGWHGRALTAAEMATALAELKTGPRLTIDAHRPPGDPITATVRNQRPVSLPAYAQGAQVATRQAFGEALKALGDARDDVLALDAEVANSTHTDLFKRAHSERFFELFIAEQLMVGVAQGLSFPSRKIVFCSTFAAFFTRAYDQIRMAAVSRADLRLCGTHAGISIGEDGPSQMGLEDLALMRAVCGSTVLYPSDAVATAHLVQAMAERQGISYLRATRGATPVIYAANETFPIGGSKTLRSSPRDRATLIGAGITLHEALAAADQLAREGIAVRVIDLYSIKPIDVEALATAATETGHLVVCEDHWAEGGIGDAVVAALMADGCALPALTHLAVREMPRSGKPRELLDHFGISAPHLVAAVKGHGSFGLGMDRPGRRP
jgi:transketolase